MEDEGELGLIDRVEITQVESEALESESRDERDLDRQLARAAAPGSPWRRDEFRRLPARVARVYRGSQSITRLELLQEGVVGMLRALERYDPSLDVSFLGVRRLVGSRGHAAAGGRADAAPRATSTGEAAIRGGPQPDCAAPAIGS